MALVGGVALQFAPSFPELLETLWRFVVAWVIKYWYVLVILGVFFYTRHYRNVRRAFGGEPPLGSSFAALNQSFNHLGEIATQTSIRLFIFLGLAAGGFLWLLQSVGTLWYGATGFEPVILGNLAALGTALAAAAGVEGIRPWHAAAAFISVVGLALLVRMFWQIDPDDIG